MVKDSDIIRIVKEDILRILYEKNKEASFKFIRSKIRVSSSFLFKAVKELKKENLLETKNNLLKLTGEGKNRSKNIIKKHLVLEDYFRKTRTKKEAHEAANILEHYVSIQIINIIKKLSTLKKDGVPLTDLKQKEGLITDIIFRSGLFERAVSMGIFPGERIRIINKISGGIIVKIKNKKFALDKEIAKKIKVIKYEKY